MPLNKDYQSGYNITDILQDEESPKTKPIQLFSPFKGLNYIPKPSELDIAETPYHLNGRIVRGYLEPRPGTTLLFEGVDTSLVKKIAYMEADETDWYGMIGTVTQDGTYNRLDEPTGDSLLSLKCVTSNDAWRMVFAYRILATALDLSQFGTGLISTNDDYICFYTYHDTRANINAVRLQLSTPGVPGGYFSYELPLADFTAGDNQETLWRVQKDAFTSYQNADWANITTIGLWVECVSGQQVTIYFDKLQLEVDSTRGFTGTIMYIGEFKLFDGTTYTIIITTKAIYYSADNSIFTRITYSGGDFLGDTNDRFWALSAPDADYFIFCQGKDKVLYIDSNLNAVNELTSYSAKYALLFGDRLLLGHLTDLPNQIRWSISGSGPAHYKDWSGTGSGYKNFTEGAGEITGMGKLAETGLVYQSDCINHITRTGQSESPFDFKARLGIGVYIPGSLFQLRDLHGFWGDDNAYIYDLNSLTPVGDKVKDTFLANIDTNYLNTAHSLINEEYDEVQLFYPSLNSATPNKVLVFNYSMHIFTSEWDLSANASGKMSNQTSRSWNNLTEAWSLLSETWNSFIVKSRPIYAMGDGEGLWKQDPSVATDNGVAFTYELWTKDFRDDLSKMLATFTHIINYYSSTAAVLLIALSGDGGESWTTNVSLTLTATDSLKLKRTFANFIQSYEAVTIRIKSITGLRFQIVRQTLESKAFGDIIE